MSWFYRPQEPMEYARPLNWLMLLGIAVALVAAVML